MAVSVNLTASKLATYLGIADKQRTRAANKFVQDYGPESATVKEIEGEIAVLRSVINELKMLAAKETNTKK